MKRKVLLLVVVALIGVLIGGLFGGSALAAGGKMNQTLEAILARIEGKLDDPATGLAEIKAEVESIETKLDDPVTGLSEIKNEVTAIEDKVDNMPRKWSHGELLVLNYSQNFGSWKVPDYEVGHFSISIYVWNMDAGEEVIIEGYIGGSSDWYAINVDTITSDGFYTYEFDGVGIEGSALVTDKVVVLYSVFATY